MPRNYRPARTPIRFSAAEVAVGAFRQAADGTPLDEHDRPIYFDEEAEVDRQERAYLL
ncbi:hypothetical protein [Phycicoccus sp.]|uniref:hypothetical protein n=1 Tax=Phycicoccus sp. TaxID=1902410 RepID=UPI002C15368E|nr:hypothetical protein [Phycicoccus sp.]HMM95416.1 hypothetical protein [Phycicoccus sp.]